VRLSWTLNARQDLEAIAAFIGRDSPVAAGRQIALLRQTALETLRFPHIVRLLPEAGQEDLRERVLGNYRLVYQVFPEEVRVLMVLEGHRLLPELPE